MMSWVWVWFIVDCLWRVVSDATLPHARRVHTAGWLASATMSWRAFLLTCSWTSTLGRLETHLLSRLSCLVAVNVNVIVAVVIITIISSFSVLSHVVARVYCHNCVAALTCHLTCHAQPASSYPNSGANPNPPPQPPQPHSYQNQPKNNCSNCLHYHFNQDRL
jgi:hypothetical protein